MSLSIRALKKLNTLKKSRVVITTGRQGKGVTSDTQEKTNTSLLGFRDTANRSEKF